MDKSLPSIFPLGMEVVGKRCFSECTARPRDIVLYMNPRGSHRLPGALETTKQPTGTEREHCSEGLCRQRPLRGQTKGAGSKDSHKGGQRSPMTGLKGSRDAHSGECRNSGVPVLRVWPWTWNSGSDHSKQGT